MYVYLYVCKASGGNSSHFLLSVLAAEEKNIMNVGGDSEFQDKIITVTAKNMMHLLENHSTPLKRNISLTAMYMQQQVSIRMQQLSSKKNQTVDCEAKSVSMSTSLAPPSSLYCRVFSIKDKAPFIVNIIDSIKEIATSFFHSLTELNKI